MVLLFFYISLNRFINFSSLTFRSCEDIKFFVTLVNGL